MLQDYIVQIPLFAPTSRYEDIPVIWDKHEESTDVLIIREKEGTIIEELDEEDFDNAHAWVDAMREKYNVVNMPPLHKDRE